MVSMNAVEAVWGGMKGRIIVVLPSVHDTQNVVGDDLIGRGSVFSLPAFLMLLGQNYPDSRLPFDLCKNVTGKACGANLVLIGGPESNSVTARILNHDRVRNKLQYVFEGYRLFDKVNQRHYEARANGEKVDYGFIWKGANPFREGKRIYITAGSRTFGTLAGSASLCDMQFVEKFAEKFDSGPFELLVEWSHKGHRKKDITRVISPPGLAEFPTMSMGEIQPGLMNLPKPAYSPKSLPRLTSVDIIVACALIFGGLLAVFLGVTKNMHYSSVPGFFAVAAGIWHILIQGR